MATNDIPTVLITSLNKGLGLLDRPTPPASAGGLGWNLLREEISLPAAVLSEDRIAHNLRWMQRFVEQYSLRLAPHGKTTMAPKLFQRQLAAGAWGITLATAHQSHVAHQHGVRRVLMANQLVGRRNMEIVSRLLDDPTFEYFCIVDSVANVDQLGRFFSDHAQRLCVLLELGVMGGRTGVRTTAQEVAVVEAIGRWPGTLQLAGIEVYEGVLKEEADIRAFLRRAVESHARLTAEGRFSRTPAILTGAGSAWYDVVAEEFATAQESAEVVLRPGCYLTHDVGVYRAAQEEIQVRNPVARAMGSGLLPALRIWAYVQSIPEPERAIIGMGKRDAAFDAGLPEPALHYRPGTPTPRPAPTHWAVTGMMDQHAYLAISPGELVVGDMIGFDVSHPCLTFDKWRHIPVVDADFNVLDVIQTFF
jgi:D-serine dehydratase